LKETGSEQKGETDSGLKETGSGQKETGLGRILTGSGAGAATEELPDHAADRAFSKQERQLQEPVPPFATNKQHMF
jgi:hypothetical protein